MPAAPTFLQCPAWILFPAHKENTSTQELWQFSNNCSLLWQVVDMYGELDMDAGVEDEDPYRLVLVMEKQ